MAFLNTNSRRTSEVEDSWGDVELEPEKQTRQNSTETKQAKSPSQSMGPPKSKTFAMTFSTIGAFSYNLVKSNKEVIEKHNMQLVEAITANDPKEVRELVRNGIVNIHSTIRAVMNNDNSTVLEDLLADEFIDITSKHESGAGLLHIASEEGAVSCTGLLLAKGLSPCMWNETGTETPIHCAVRSGNRNSRKILELLFNNGGDVNIGRNKACGSPVKTATRMNNSEMLQFLIDNNADAVWWTKSNSETSLHIACEFNYYRCAEIILKASPNSKNFKSESHNGGTALHIAAYHGYTEITELLLDFNADMCAKNNDGMTALHLAAKKLFEPLLNIILEKYVKMNMVQQTINASDLINARDRDGRTPLFAVVCAKGGDNVLSCMRVLIDNEADVNVQDDSGYTVLHLAAIEREINRVNLLITYDADIGLINNAGLSAFHFIEKKVPQCVETFGKRLDSGINVEGEKSEFGARLSIDFNKIVKDINSSALKPDISIFSELASSHHMGHKQLLKHPLIQAYLQLKWNQIKFMHTAVILVPHLIFCTFYTVYALLIFRTLCGIEDREEEHKECNLKVLNEEDPYNIKLAKFAWIYCLVLSVPLYTCREISRILTEKWKYFFRVESYLDICCIITTCIISAINPFDEVVTVPIWKYHLAAVGCFIIWITMMLQVGKMPRFGKYVQMFLRVSVSVIDFLAAYIFLLLAFFSCFFILFPNNPAFQPQQNIMGMIKVFVMMLGELDYGDLYYNQNDQFNWPPNNDSIVHIENETEKQVFPFTAHIVVFFFVVFVSIILMNLLVGLAVSDIQELQRSGKLYTLIHQVELIEQMEGLHRQFSTIFFHFLPVPLQQAIRAKFGRIHGKYSQEIVIKVFDQRNSILTKKLKDDLYDHCTSKQKKSEQDKRDKAITEILRLIRCQQKNKGYNSKDSVFETPHIKPTWSRSASTTSSPAKIYNDEEDASQKRYGFKHFSSMKKKSSIQSINEAETPDIKEEEEESQSETEDYNQ